MEAQSTQNYNIYIEFSNEEQYLRFQDILQDVKGLKYTHPQPLRSNFYCHINYSLKTDKPNTEPLRFYVIICVINHGDTPDLSLGAAVTCSGDVCFCLFLKSAWALARKRVTAKWQLAAL